MCFNAFCFLLLVVRCVYEGTEYSPGSEIFRGVDEKKRSCYSLICSVEGEVVLRDRKRCKTNKHTVAFLTTMPPIHGDSEGKTWQKSVHGDTTASVPFSHKTSGASATTPGETTLDFLWTEPLSTEEPTTIFTEPTGCHVNGRFFPRGAEISEGYDEHSDWCYGQFCNHNGAVISWDTWNCKGMIVCSYYQLINLHFLLIIIFIMNSIITLCCSTEKLRSKSECNPMTTESFCAECSLNMTMRYLCCMSSAQRACNSPK